MRDLKSEASNHSPTQEDTGVDKRAECPCALHAFLECWCLAAPNRAHALQMAVLADVIHSFLDGGEVPIAVAYDLAGLQHIGVGADEIRAAAQVLAAARVIGFKELDAKQLLVFLPWVPDGAEEP